MNKDRRIVAQVVADLVGAYTGERSIPNKVLMICRDAVKGLAETEARSVKKMEAFKDTENTARNYQNGVACRDDLEAAQEALEEGELEEAYTFLIRVSDPEAALRNAKQALANGPRKSSATPARRTRKKVRK